MSRTIGQRITEMRKEKGMTQAQLAEQMGVTDKAVSKWERNLSCPDISSIPKLAEVLDLSVEELMQGREAGSKEKGAEEDIVGLILKAVPLAMGVAVAVLSVMGKVELRSAVTMLGIGLACAAVSLLRENNKK